MEDCPYSVALKVIDTSLWDIPATVDSSAEHATTWVAKAIHDYNVSMAWDDDLFADYKWDFEDWTKEMFGKVERTTLRSLKSILRHRGVYTGNNHARLADSLYSLLGKDEPLVWDPTEFQATHFDKRSRAYERQQSHKLNGNPVAGAYLKTILPADAELSQQEQPQPEPEGKTSDTQQGELYRTGPGIQSQPKTPDLLQQVHPTKAPPQPVSYTHLTLPTNREV